MANVNKARASARGWLTRVTTKLTELINAEVKDKGAIIDALEEFNTRLAAVDDAQFKLEMSLEDEDLEAEILTASMFRDKANDIKVKAVAIVADMDNASARQDEYVGAGVDAGSIATVALAAKLPKLQLPSFSGNVMEWSPFWEQFEVTVHQSDLPDVSKFTYLRSLLKGEAKHAVSGLSLTGEHYASACELLRKRFGSKEKIIFSHIQELLAWDISKGKSGNMWSVYDTLISHVRSLEIQGIDGKQYGVVLTPLILSRLPQDLRMEWAREGEGHEGDLQWLLDFLEGELRRRERSQTFSKESPALRETERRKQQGTATALHSTTHEMCPICNKTGHNIERCFILTRSSVADRKAALRQVGACFKCLSFGQSHSYRHCSNRCAKCNGRHHVILCDSHVKADHVNTQTERSFHSNDMSRVTQNNDVKLTAQAMPSVSNVTCVSANNVSDVFISNSSVAVSKRVLLQIASIPVRSQENGTVDAVVLFDTGADRTYVTQQFVEKVRPKWVGSRCLSQAVFGSSIVGDIKQRNLYELQFQGNSHSAKVVAAEVPIVCAPLRRPAVSSAILDSFSDGIKFLDVPAGQQVEVDLLIGLDYYWNLMTGQVVKATNGLVAQCSIFGWILSGTLQGPIVNNSCNVSHQLFCCSISEAGLQNFWDLEMLGIADKEDTTAHPVLTEFQKNVGVSESGRYQVALPWKSELARNKLLNNEKLALSRLDNLSFRLTKVPNLEQRYHKVFRELLSEGIIEEIPGGELVSSQPTFYMPHRPIVKESSLSTKIRPVFDASAKGHNGISLNDCLETGPSLLPDLLGILIRFRRWKVALTADVTKAFLQIEVRREDRDVHRFLWNDQGLIRKMRFTRVPFGNKSSPFLLNATVKHHLSQFPDSRVIRELSQNLYVDDWLSGCDDSVEGCEMLKEAVRVMSLAGMSLTKWGSNSDEVEDFVSREFQDKSLTGDSLKVLGMKWESTGDSFLFDGAEVTDQLCVTKRIILSFISRLFDPLGLLAPFIMVAKCLFQELWRIGVGWDEVVDESISNKFSQWVGGLMTLRAWRIPRSYTDFPWKDCAVIQLQGFGDASQSAYGACVYLQVLLSNGTWRSSLVMARAKVAPLKKLTLPRLELLGALLCARLIVYVRQELRLPVDITCQCWTDSTVTLAWIKSDPHRWKPFVGNRVAEIQGLVAPSQWQHCPGTENPADLVTRGISAEDLTSSTLWLQGPRFLQNPNFTVNLMHRSDDFVSKDQSLISISQERADPTPNVAEESPTPSVIPLERWSSLSKAIRIIAWMLRFRHNCKVPLAERKQGDLSLTEMQDARTKLVKNVQAMEYSKELSVLGKRQPIGKKSPLAKLSPFIDEDGLLRVQGRLQFAGLPFDATHPIIIPKGHFGLLLARQVHVTLKHAGVNSMLVEIRNRYWLIGARRICKQVKHECLPCKYLDARAGAQPMAPLPQPRVTPSPPFATTGIDHGGPLYCCDFVGKKFYILLATCAVTRAVHLELVDSLSTETTVLALRRFIARRGLPGIIMSDNARAFGAASKLMLELYGLDCPKWIFNTPRAPWWGGWWERLIGSMKSSLKRSIGKRTLTRVELETLVQEVESCLNARPLTFVGDDIESGGVLTPSHFLLGRSGLSPPESVDQNSVSDRVNLLQRDEFRKAQLEKFWCCWVQEYLCRLPPCRGPAPEGGVKEGSVVLVEDIHSSRLSWPLGVVCKTYPGRDGLVRSVDVKTAKGIYTRPVQRIHDLELSQDNRCTEPTLNTEFHDFPSKPDNEAQDTVTLESDDIPDDKRITRFGRLLKRPIRLDL